MVTLLARLFIKAKPNGHDPGIRRAYGILCGAVGIALNLLLFSVKLIAGAAARSVAISADAFNNLSDAGSSIITLIGFGLSGQRPDSGHPFGHGRIEYVTGLIVSMAILLMGFELLQSSIKEILNPEPIVFSLLPVLILLASIAAKLYMAYYNRKIGVGIQSAAMRATAVDSLSDTIATAAVLVSMAVSHGTGWQVDGWCGLLVALLILVAGVRAMRDTVNPLLGQPPSRETIDAIEAIVAACPQIVGTHDLMVHDYGPGRLFISLHAEVSAQGDILVMHDAVDNVEKELREKLQCAAVIHMDPIVTDDALTNETRSRVAEVVKGLDERITIHDFRMVSGPTHTNVIFDAVVPFDVKLTEKEIGSRIAHMVRALDLTYYAVVEVDRCVPK